MSYSTIALAMRDLLSKQDRELECDEAFSTREMAYFAAAGEDRDFERVVVAPRLSRVIASRLEPVLLDSAILSSRPMMDQRDATVYYARIAVFSSEELTLLNRIKNTLMRDVDPRDA